MFDQINNYKNKFVGSQFSDVRTLALLAFGVIVILVSWSGVKATQRNYELQKQIAKIEQENAVKRLENDNQKLRNEYLQTDQYLELAARSQFGLAALGEKVVIIPKAVALSRVAGLQTPTAAVDPAAIPETKPQYQQNIEAWLDFFMGRADKPK